MVYAFVFIAIDAATTETTDIAKYESLRINGYPENSLIRHFRKNSHEAENVVFRYFILPLNWW